MTTTVSPNFATRPGYMTDQIKAAYIEKAVKKGDLPQDAHRMADILSLLAPEDANKPIQFWQLYSVLGQDPIVNIVANFYERVFRDEPWFTSVFERVGPIGHHINTQAAMWIDVMGGGPYYHGAEFRLNFHHTHNAHQLMNDKGAERWTQLMLDTLEEAMAYLPDDPRVRASLNTFLDHFMGKYAEDFNFGDHSIFGETNMPYKRKINFMKMTDAQIEALSEGEIAQALSDRGVDVSQFSTKSELIAKAQMM